MEFIKERNFIAAYEDGIKMGAWNITTGQFIGKRGLPVKSVPVCFNYDNLPCNRYDMNNSDLLGYAVRKFREWMADGWKRYNTTNGARMEQLLSVGLLPDDFNTLENDLILNKKIIKYIKDECRGVYLSNRVNDYITRLEYQSYLDTLPEWAADVFMRLIRIKELPIDYVKSALKRIINEHVYSFWGRTSCTNTSNIVNMVSEYYKISMQLYDKVELDHNFLTKYAILKYLQEEYKNKHYNEGLSKANDKPWLYFEDEEYFARPILTKEDFHFEGENQHNCVERLYMERVYNKNTHVVSIRLKRAPKETCITCEVDNHGRIIQYLGRCNSHPTSAEAKSFYSAYQRHIYNAIKEESDS